MFSIILFKTILINVLEYYFFEIINEKVIQQKLRNEIKIKYKSNKTKK